MKKKKTAKKATKAVTWRDKLDSAWGWVSDKSSRLWSKLMNSAFDEEFPLAFGLVLTGGAILAGCLAPWTVIALLAVVVGGAKLYHLFKWH
jgi:hypothetical protein